MLEEALTREPEVPEELPIRESEAPMTELEPMQRRSTRIKKVPSKFDDMVLLAHESHEEPNCYKAASRSEDQNHWMKAMEEEMDSIEKNHAWDLVKLPDGRFEIINF
ncbi:hypothetical protein O6H91_12G096100 [Diphasiastrum complanatum]|uniref:Uncharacterized protein n=1 Tax=Diphasiastrum complanatum TaxID=34168 RepID=A0ACC2C521_DIPCM|nr:hypothetical protein O6H91_12G096100 [Diphasiastrum complanatum]